MRAREGKKRSRLECAPLTSHVCSNHKQCGSSQVRNANSLVWTSLPACNDKTQTVPSIHTLSASPRRCTCPTSITHLATVSLRANANGCHIWTHLLTCFTDKVGLVVAGGVVFFFTSSFTGVRGASKGCLLTPFLSMDEALSTGQRQYGRKEPSSTTESCETSNPCQQIWPIKEHSAVTCPYWQP